MKYKKQNIEIINEHYFDKIEELDVCIELYSNDVLKFRVYRNSKVDACNSSTVHAYDGSTVYAYENSIAYANDTSKVDAYYNSLIYAKDSSTVRARHNSTVRAYDSSTVHAFDCSGVDARGGSIVHAHNNSEVDARCTSKVYAKDSSRVDAYNSSTIYAKDSSTVRAYDSSTVRAYDSSTVYALDYSIVYACEFCTIYIYNLKVKTKTENHFGAIIKQVFKLKKDILVYKKLELDRIATLKLVKGQTFQSKRFDKCRTDRALVVSIENIDKTESFTSGVSTYDNNCVYEVGKEVVADRYDKYINECSNGIHFFLTREKAEKY